MDSLDLLKPIPIDKLREHIAKLSEIVREGSAETGWDVEFNFLEQRTREDPKYEKTTELSCLEANKPKNRYTNVLAADETIVKLPRINQDDIHSDYINANWISGPDDRPRCYIACQGPLSETINDFWWMVWSENVKTIVMLTREEEKDTAKCQRYWPNSGDLHSKHFKVKLLSSENDKYNAIYKRTLSLKNKKTGDEKIVIHFQYTEWPDYGVPREFELDTSPFAFMGLIHDVDASNSDHPLAVHCSAGIGRTGTFFSVHIIMLKLREWYDQKKEGTPAINIISTILKLREQRSGMVQTKGQFMFIYSAVLFEAEHLKKETNAGTRITVSDMQQDNQTQLRSTRKHLRISRDDIS